MKETVFKLMAEGKDPKGFVVISFTTTFCFLRPSN